MPLRRAKYPRPAKPISIIAHVEGSGVPIGGGALPRPWMNAAVSKFASLASATMNVRVLVLPGTYGSAIRNDGAPVFDQHALQRRRLKRIPVDSSLERKVGIHHTRIIDVDRISTREGNVGAVEKEAEAIDEVVDELRVFS